MLYALRYRFREQCGEYEDEFEYDAVSHEHAILSACNWIMSRLEHAGRYDAVLGVKVTARVKGCFLRSERPLS